MLFNLKRCSSIYVLYSITLHLYVSVISKIGGHLYIVEVKHDECSISVEEHNRKYYMYIHA